MFIYHRGSFHLHTQAFKIACSSFIINYIMNSQNKTCWLTWKLKTEYKFIRFATAKAKEVKTESLGGFKTFSVINYLFFSIKKEFLWSLSVIEAPIICQKAYKINYGSSIVHKILKC
jgi:hypothetical protein